MHDFLALALILLGFIDGQVLGLIRSLANVCVVKYISRNLSQPNEGAYGSFHLLVIQFLHEEVNFTKQVSGQRSDICAKEIASERKSLA